MFELTSSFVLPILTFAIATAFSPGPNNIMLLSSGLNFGYKRTLALISGIMLGFSFMVIAVGLGIGELFEIFPWFYTLLKVIGVLYLLWMAVQIAQTKGTLSTTKSEQKPFTFLQAILFQWVNPKAWIMTVTSTSSFINNENSIPLQVLFIAFVYFIIGLFSTHSWALGGVFLQRIIQDEKRLHLFNMFMALLIILSLIPLLVEV